MSSSPADAPFEDKMRRLVETLGAQIEKGRGLEAAIASNLKELGYDG